MVRIFAFANANIRMFFSLFAFAFACTNIKNKHLHSHSYSQILEINIRLFFHPGFHKVINSISIFHNAICQHVTQCSTLEISDFAKKIEILYLCLFD